MTPCAQIEDARERLNRSREIARAIEASLATETARKRGLVEVFLSRGLTPPPPPPNEASASADASEERDLSALLPAEVHRLGSRLLTYAKEAAEIPPLGDKPPWQGDGYYCAKCKVGKPVGKGKQASWEPWCEGASGVACGESDFA